MTARIWGTPEDNKKDTTYVVSFLELVVGIEPTACSLRALPETPFWGDMVKKLTC